MFDFFEKIKTVVTEKAVEVKEGASVVASVVARKTEQTVEIQKIKNHIYGLRRDNDNDYKAMGKLIYERFKNGEGVDSEFVGFCDNIAEREDEIKIAKKEISDLKD